MSVELKVSGMTCTHCERAVQEALVAVPGVTDVKVDRSNGFVSVTGDVDSQALIAAISEEGYQAELTA